MINDQMVNEKMVNHRMITLLIILTIMSLFHKNKAEESNFPPNVCKMEYCVRGTVMYPFTHFVLTKAENERYWLYNASNCDEKDARKVEVPKSFADSIRQIVAEEKMLEYSSYYKPPYQVLDGITWKLYIGFEDKKTCVSSAGHEEYPDGDGLSRLEKLCRETWKANEKKARPAPLKEEF